MWCDNCLCLFPLRAGAMVLGTIMAIYEIGGGIFLFKLGGYYFTIMYSESTIYGGYAFAQGALALLAVIALSSRSYVFTRFMFLIYPVIILIGAIRAGVMVWSLNHYEGRIDWGCQNGISWADANEAPYIFPPSYEHAKLPTIFCSVGTPYVISVFTIFLIADLILMLYYYFLIWRFNVRLQHYPVQKNEFVYP